MSVRSFLYTKWTCYGLATLLFALLQLLVLDHIFLLQAYPFLLPVLAAVAAVYEGAFQGGIYSLALGLLADLLLASGPVSSFYTIALTVAALLAALLAKYWLAPGFLCSLIAAVTAFLAVDLLRLLLYALQGQTLLPLLLLCGKEMLLSLPFVLPVNWLFSRICRRFRLD